MRKVAFCTGISGQVCSYLAELLLEEGFEVHGLRRRKAVDNLDNLQGVLAHPDLHLVWGDVEDGARLAEVIMDVQPTHIFNFAAQSQVRISFDTPAATGNVTGIAVARLLELTKRIVPEAKFYQASSSEMYGSTPAPQSETSPMVPVSPYGAAKLYAYHLVKIYRAQGLHATNGITFNADSPRRGTQFVTRKIVQAVARIHAGKQQNLVLGNLDAKRDWMHAKDAVRGIYDMMQLPDPVDLCIGSGETHSVEEFVDLAFKAVGKDWHDYVTFDDRLKRPTEVTVLQADCTRAKELIGWNPTYTFQTLVEEMVNAELARV